jgi:hypothetical protein
LRAGLAPRSLWRLPPDVQLPARLAFRAVRPAVLPQLVKMSSSAGMIVRRTASLPLAYVPGIDVFT